MTAAGIFGRCLVGLLLFGWAVGLSAQGQQPDETLPGFKTNNTLEAHGIDNVNLFSGDPGVVIPLGPSYPLGPGSSFQLQAHYSVKFWYFDSLECGVPSEIVTHALVNGYPTLGMGWTLELGYVDASYYHSPDGGRHVLNSFNGQPPFFTVDGTHLRVTPIPPSSPTSYKVEFPDGSIQTFAQQYTLPRAVPDTSPDFSDGNGGTRFGLTQIKDAFGTVLLTVNYAGANLTADAWRVTSINLVGRTQPITYNWTLYNVYDVFWWVVTSISFPHNAGQTTNATFTFTPFGFTRNAYDHSHNSPCPTPSLGVSVPLLSTISLGSLATYKFGYGARDESGGFLQGALNQIFLPTNGTINDPTPIPSIQYAYDITATRCAWQNLVQCADPETGIFAPGPGFAPTSNGNPFLPWLDFSPGISSRTVTDTTTGVSSVTYYTRRTVVATRPEGINWVPDEFKAARSVIVRGPSGNGTSQISTRYVFHTQIIEPFLSSGAELARRYYPDGNSTGTGTPIRALINCYEADGDSGPTCGYRDTSGQISVHSWGDNFRRQGAITWYGENPLGGGVCPSGSTLCTASLSSGYNTPAGKYSTTTVTSTLTPMAGWSSRTTTTLWNPNIDATHWLLNLFDSTSATDAGAPSPSSVSTSYTFNRNNGFLLGDTTSDGYGTLTHTYCNNGDCAGVTGTGNTTPVTTSGSGGLTGSFRDDRTFQTPLVLTQTRSGISWKSFDVDRDPNTGLVTASRDPNASLQTAYSYDALGRVTSIVPPGNDASTTISYDSTIQTTVSRSGADGNGTFQRYIYDSLGRLIREIRQMPSNYAFRVHGFDTAGHANFVSEWGSCSSVVSPNGDCLTMSFAGTTSSNFDPFDRAQRITGADQTYTLIDRTDGSILFSDSLESVQVAVGTTGAPNSMTATRKDAVGRIISVTEDVGGAGDVTSYTYNVLDKLAGVTQGSQTRAFIYDAFGFLRSETTPEKGTVGYTSPSPSYDALGSVLSETQNDGTQILRLYDLAGRLTKATAGGNVFLRNCYDGQASCVDAVPGFAGGSYPFSKLTRRYGYNPVSNPALTVTDDFSYSNSTGRLSSETSGFNPPGSLPTATQSWNYNSLSLVSQHAHYRPSGAPFVVTNLYSQGLPTTEYANGIPVVSGVTYAPSGALNGYTTGLGIGPNIATTIQQDGWGMPRPSQIWAQVTGGPNPHLFDTGTYAYDGAGNIRWMTNGSSDSYGYDARSRLTSATLTLSGLANQSYSYDRYGNRASQLPSGCQIDVTKNRLSNIPGQSCAAGYDLRGNMTQTPTSSFTYDSLDRTMTAPGWTYLYDGASERVVKTTGLRTYTLRDEGKRVSVEFTDTAQQSRDNVFLGNLLVASYANQQVGPPGSNGPAWTFYSSDHFGTPRLITDLAGATVATPKYLPFGEEQVSSTLERVRFASMERDTEGSWYHDHARNHEFNLGRFLSPDTDNGEPEEPQSWNRYPYSRNNPLALIDPDGRAVKIANLYLASPETAATAREVAFGTNSAITGSWAIAKVTDFVLSSLLPKNDSEAVANAQGAAMSTGCSLVIPGAIVAKAGTSFLVTEAGEAVVIPKGAVPKAPRSGTGLVYEGGSGGNGLHPQTTGVRVMDANQNQGARVNYMNKSGHTVDPATGRQISKADPRGHIPLKPAPPPAPPPLAPCPSGGGPPCPK